MTIQINDQLFISEIQKKFSDAFPFLRLSFFRPAWNPLLIRLQPEISTGEQLASLKKEKTAAAFSISPGDKVSAIEQNFRKLYTLEAQVMRRSGNNWLMTGETDKYTLEEQNALGIEMSVTVPAAGPEDIHEQE